MYCTKDFPARFRVQMTCLSGGTEIEDRRSTGFFRKRAR
jgi:hypothetical protein